ncbi:CBS domain-containing protein [Thermomonospora umbrina]|uniref:CBS domain protein n=1 Tax=Thermomonospora umbrina TaxID=111806 RepID=A0A3D9STT7_9ACTN|nr:CBS domain-containing protein [Thermomonospora umbrina]REE95984.1 CBS domain protein [Thermomonospora umbrina]
MTEQPATLLPPDPAVVGRTLAGRTVADAMLHHPKVHDHTVSVAELQDLFLNVHVHAALIVDPARRLLTIVERADLTSAAPSPAHALGRLDGRTTHPTADLVEVWGLMVDQGRRRLAVVDDSGTLLGLLALKRSRLGFCSDAGVLARRRERRGEQPSA